MDILTQNVAWKDNEFYFKKGYVILVSLTAWYYQCATAGAAQDKTGTDDFRDNEPLNPHHKTFSGRNVDIFI